MRFNQYIFRKGNVLVYNSAYCHKSGTFAGSSFLPMLTISSFHGPLWWTSSSLDLDSVLPGISDSVVDGGDYIETATQTRLSESESRSSSLLLRGYLHCSLSLSLITFYRLKWAWNKTQNLNRSLKVG